MKTYYNEFFGLFEILEPDLELLVEKELNPELEVLITFYKEFKEIPNSSIDFEKAKNVFLYIKNNIQLITEKVIDDLMCYDKEYLEREGYSRKDLEEIELSSVWFEISEDFGGDIEKYTLSTTLTFDDNDIFGNHLINVDLNDDMGIEDVRIEG